MTVLPLLLLRLALPLDAAPSLQEEVTKAKPATPAGAARVVDLFHERLLVPPGRLDPAARSLCSRFLPAAADVVRSKGSCESRARAVEALAMCRWLAADDEAARTLALELSAVRCPDASPPVEGVDRALTLALRWLWPEPLDPVVGAMSDAPGPGREARRRLLRISDLRAAARRAAGGAHVSGGVLLASVGPDTPAARGGLRSGDLVLTAASHSVRDADELLSHLPDPTADTGPRSVPVTYLREGRKLEARWSGDASGVEVVPLPERFSPR